MIFDKSQKEDMIDLKIRITPNSLPDRKPRGRSRKELALLGTELDQPIIPKITRQKSSEPAPRAKKFL